jgi:NAD(P)-dependent dehydrogenase (short-subunit alcohol dehydrogenase family)
MTLPAPEFSMDLTGHTALVTGGSSGLGWRFAQILAAAGARVAVASRRTERLTRLVGEIREAGGEAIAIGLDVTDSGQIVHAVEAAQNSLGTINILVNCAGIASHAPATDIAVEELDLMLATNLRGPYILSCEIARRLIQQKLPGRIVNIASMAAFHCDDSGISAYAVTKSGIVRMTEALAVEWAKFNINVNAIAPGAFQTEMLDEVLAHNPGLAAHFPRRRIGRPGQLDSTLLYLVSPSSEFVTGTCIKVDDAQAPR